MHRTLCGTVVMLAAILTGDVLLAQFQAGPVLPILGPIRQGGFEWPDQGNDFAYTPGGSFWAFTGGTGLAGNGSGFTRFNPPAPQGDQVCFIQNASNSTVSQKFIYPAGRYRFRVKAAQRLRGNGNLDQQTISLRIDGTEILSITPPDENYTQYITDYILLDSSSHVLTFVGMQNGGNSAFIDQAQVQSLNATADNWSDPGTWQNGVVPGPTVDATIPLGQTVLLDTDANVKSLTVLGSLYCKDDDVSITANFINVSGWFECGSETSPHLQNMTMTLNAPHNHPPCTPPETPNCEQTTCDTRCDGTFEPSTKHLMAIQGGTIELHGEPRLSWTQISATAAVGDTSITVIDPVDWRIGDQIVIAPTSENTNEGEEVTITNVSNNGLTIDFTPGLQFEHYGEQTTYNNGVTSWVLDERAEVGLLTRNIVLKAAEGTTSDGYGAHMMTMNGAFSRVSGVEFYQVGQAGHLARYPFHWHLAGDATGQYIRNCSIHNSYHRCVTLHGTNNADISDNVCYDILGHAYFIENGTEVDNTFDHNLGILTRKVPKVDAVLESDYRNGSASNGPATFWIRHPDNIYTNNAAAGSEGSGYWYGMLQGDDSLFAQFGKFENNRVHSSRQGYTACSNPSGPHGMNPPTPAVLQGLTVSNCKQGVWPCAASQTAEKSIFKNMIVANCENGFQAPNPVALEDSLFVGYSNNAPQAAELGSNSNWRGVQVYDQGFLFTNIHFENYDRPFMTAFFPGGGAHKHANNRAIGLTFNNAPNVFLDPNNFWKIGNVPGWWGDVIHDLDGSLVGDDWAFVAGHPVMFDRTCTQPTNMNTDGYACPYRYAHFRSEHFASIDPITVIRSDGYSNTSGHINARFITEIIMDDSYFYTYRYSTGLKFKKLQVSLRNAFGGDNAVYEFLDVPSTFSIPTSGWQQASSVDDLMTGAGHRYVWRDHSLFLKMQASGDDWHATDIVDICLRDVNCALTHEVGTPPVVTITAPPDGARYPVGAGVIVRANITDPSGSAPIVSAQLYLNTTLIGSDIDSPYLWRLLNIPQGDHVLKVVAINANGDTFTQVQQMFGGDVHPRIEITSHTDNMTVNADTPITIDYDLANWGAAGEHLHWYINNEYQGDFTPGTQLMIPVNGLSQGVQELKIALAAADETVLAINDTVRLYAMKNYLIADYETGVDTRTSFTADDTNIGQLSKIKFAWGTQEPEASYADGQDDINYFDVYDNQDGTFGFATYRLNLDPQQDWSSFISLEIRSSSNLDFECFVVDATQGSTSLGFRTTAGSITTLDLELLPSTLIDEVIAIELRFDESTIAPDTFHRLHLEHIRLIEDPTIP